MRRKMPFIVFIGLAAEKLNKNNYIIFFYRSFQPSLKKGFWAVKRGK